ncbi:histone deacetylase 7-like isoform X1 [Osmerus eperlanus]|uniref:histone deacetylase 7-like isoform X1 n=2 Tax=Osmerus eperlanus TaxID=29151 RepID=UPI002E117AFF
MSNFNIDVKPRAEIKSDTQEKRFSTLSAADVPPLGTVASAALQREQAMDLSVTQHMVRPGPDPATLVPRHLPLHTYNMESQRHRIRELDLLMHKTKNSAVASPQVKQRLRDLIISKKNVQAALERTSSNPSNTTTLGYRELGRDPDMPPKPQMVMPALRPPHERPLRRTASEPILKAKPKTKKHYSRPNPLRRKTSAPPTVKHRTPETLDSSPSSSSTPVSGCSSPNDSLRSESGVIPLTTGLTLEVQRLMLQDGICSSAMPTITAGLPAQRLQPVLILEPNTGLLHTQLLSVPSSSYNHSVLHLLSHPPSPLLRGMNPASLQSHYSSSSSPSFSSSSSFSRAEAGGCHRPLGRTRSEPLPQSPPHLLQHQHSKLLLENLKENTQLRKSMTKSSEKPRLSQIPSEDRDPEESGLGSGPLHEDAYHRRRACVEPHSEALSQRDSMAELGHLQLSLTLSQPFRWGEQQRHLQALHRQYTAHSTDSNHLAVPVLVVPPVPGLAHRPLSRAQSSPASTSLPPPPLQPSSSTSEVGALSLARPASPEPSAKLCFTTGLVYDSQMLKHQCACGDNSRHPEHAGRIQSIWSRLQERGLRNQCECIRSRKATMEELQSVHSEEYVLRYGTNPLNRLKLDNRKLAGILSKRVFVTLPCGGVGVDSDTVWNETHTPTASRTAAGSVTELAFKVAQGELKNGFAVVRPPGHHALHSTPFGFCFFNSVAIAAKQLQHKLNVSKILIVDWDVHHGNSTQEVFYNDPSVLFISLHRYDNGNFFPGNGGPNEVGVGTGKGFNVNVAWTGGLDPPMGDAEYLAAFRTVVMPIAHEFSPDVVLVSAGFDAVEGHPAPLGGYKVSAKCFGFLTRQLMGLAGGRVVMALEGGYDLTAICDASEACVSALLGVETEPLSNAPLDQRPCFNAVLSLQRVIQAHSEYWQGLRSLVHTVDLSWLQAQRLAQRRDSDNTVSALASLSMGSFCGDRRHSDEEDTLMEGDTFSNLRRQY